MNENNLDGVSVEKVVADETKITMTVKKYFHHQWAIGMLVVCLLLVWTGKMHNNAVASAASLSVQLEQTKKEFAVKETALRQELESVRVGFDAAKMENASLKAELLTNISEKSVVEAELTTALAAKVQEPVTVRVTDWVKSFFK